MKFLSRFIRSIGVFGIILVSITCILMGFFTRIAHDGKWYKPYMEYITSFEANFYDYRMKPHIGDNSPNDNTVLIKVDDESLQKINSWPIPRENWAKLIDNLSAFNAKVVAFDVLFPEPVKACGLESPDDLFAKSIVDFQAKEGKSIIMAYTVQEASFAENANYFQEPPFEVFTSMVPSQIHPESKNALLPRMIEKHTWPIEKYLETESELGYLNMEEDSDGVFRHYQLFAPVISQEMDGEPLLLPSLGFRAYLSSLEVNKVQVNVNSLGDIHVSLGEENLRVNRSGESKIRWTGDEDKFKTISLYEVINADPNDKKMLEFFDNKIVFIGSTATGAHDLRNTPINSKLPGVLAHMNMVDMLKKKNFYKSFEDNIGFSIGILVVSILILVVTMFFNKAILDIFVLISLIASIYLLDYFYFFPQGYQIQLFFTFGCLVSTYSWITFLNFNQASAEKKQIKGAFSRYVAPSIVDDMLDNPDKLKVGGEKRDITCMFSDVRDFTSISEKLTATELAMALNRYMGQMTDIVFETNGTLDKYIGDAIVAFWGAPIDIGDHVNQSMDAAVKMMEALPAINEEFKAKGLPEFKIGLGLNSGECSVGNMGSDQIFAYTALGDNMNLGARLESLCKHYGAQILISEYTFDRMDQERFTSRLIDKVRVQGKTQPVGVYEVLYSYHPFMMDQKSLADFKEAYNLFLDAKFEEAKSLFESILETHHHDKACLRLREACMNWIENPPKEGEDHTITTMTTK